MAEALLIPVCTFSRVFDTEPCSEVLTLPELKDAMRRFQLKEETSQKVAREIERIARAAEALRRGEPLRGKPMARLARAVEEAMAEGSQREAAIETAKAALELDARRSAKRDLRLWSPALYRPGATERGKENVTHVSCLVLDFDEGPSIAEASDAWSPYFHLVHTTWSHEDAKPRFRLILPLSQPVAAEDWGAVWAWAEARADFEIDPSMKSPAATYALPALPSRDAPREASSRPGAIFDPVAEGIVPRRPAPTLERKRPPEGVPSRIRGEDPDQEYLLEPDALSPEEQDEVDYEAPVAAPTAPADPAPTAAEGLEPPDHGEEVAARLEAPLVTRLEVAVERMEDALGGPALVDALERLAALHRDARLTDREFASAKRRLLAKDEKAAPHSRRVGKGRHRKTIAVDFDGVIHSYTSRWRSATEIPDPPVEGAIDWLAEASTRFDIAITSVRATQPGGAEAIRAWLRTHGLPEAVLERIHLPAEKPPALVYLDDRGYRFEGTFPKLEELASLEPWNRRRAKKKR